MRMGLVMLAELWKPCHCACLTGPDAGTRTCRQVRDTVGKPHTQRAWACKVWSRHGLGCTHAQAMVRNNECNRSAGPALLQMRATGST